jgi:hypothetical protein
MPEWLLSLLVAMIVSGLGVYGSYLGRKKDRIDLADKFQQIAAKTAEDLEAERNKRRELEDRLDEIDQYIDFLLNGIKILIQQLESAKMEPCWKPGDRPTRKKKGD